MKDYFFDHIGENDLRYVDKFCKTEILEMYIKKEQLGLYKINIHKGK
jgi:hypothetical protein